MAAPRQLDMRAERKADRIAALCGPAEWGRVLLASTVVARFTDDADKSPRALDISLLDAPEKPPSVLQNPPIARLHRIGRTLLASTGGESGPACMRVWKPVAG